MGTLSSINPGRLNNEQLVGQADFIDARVLAASTAETFQAPPNAKFVRIAGDGAFFLKIATSSTAATVPAADVTDGTASECCPNGDAVWRILPGDQPYISVIATATRIVTLSYYRN
jgi:hypothetical protein